MSIEADQALLAPRHRVRAIVGSVLGLALFIAAVMALLTQRGQMSEAWAAARAAPAWLVALLVALPLGNLAVVSLSFNVLTARFGRVGWSEMAALIASAWLLNYLPLRPGMVGRVAYHKRVNGVLVRDSVRVIGESIALSALAVGMLVVVSFGADGNNATVAWLGAAPLVVGAAAALALRASGAGAWRYAAAFSLRYVDAALWVARYAVVFAVIGRPIGAAEAARVTAASQVALMVPLAGNGLGLREWAVAITSATDAGLLADVVNRGAELLIAVPAGLLGGWWIARRLGGADPKAGSDR